MSDLTETDVKMLDFERQWWKFAGAKEQAILAGFGWSATRYYQHLNALIDDPAAMAADPLLVRRLHRIPSDRNRWATPRRTAAPPGPATSH